MVGSTIIQNFGESVKNHGYATYDVNKEKYKFYPLKNTQPYLSFRIRDIEDLENEKEILVNA